MKSSSAKAQFTTNKSQNEMIEICGRLITQKIVHKVKENEVFSVLADETVDVSGKDQMALVLRYYDEKLSELCEDFVGFVELSSKTGESIANAIKKKLNDIGLSIQSLRGQGYDGASSMSGKFQGVQAKLLEDQPLAFYTHCNGHVLNLCVVDVCENSFVRNAIGTTKQVINFFDYLQKEYVY